MNQNNIKPQDLMLGNWAQYNGVNYQIDSITTKGTWISTEKGMDSVRWEEVFPIPLSEEVLLRCGAILHGIEYIIKASALPVKIRFHSGIAYCEMGNVYLGDHIKYLHELQNLIYILCGKEIEVRWT